MSLFDRVQQAERRVVLAVAVLVVLAAMVAAFWVGGFLRGRSTPPPQTARAPEPPPAVLPTPEVPEPGSAPVRPSPRRRVPEPREPEPPPEPAAPETGTLHISSDVEGASVFVDRIYVGTTPVTAANVAPGSHRLNVSAQGYDGFADTIEVAPGEREITVRFKEVKLDASIDVIHKHGIGSCRGRLVATPQGISYVTDNTNDAFSAPLLTLETFEVDYLKKNLRIKLRGGRTYNFADPDDNADRLFVFHRDVEKARERLAQGDPPAKNR
jgi:hypothetical protein